MSIVQRCDVSTLEVNDILSRGSMLRVVNKSEGTVTVQNLDGNTWDIGKSIVNNECKSTHSNKTEKLPITKIIENVIRRSNGAIMKIRFVKTRPGRAKITHLQIRLSIGARGGE